MGENMFSINENNYTQMTDEKLIENIKKEDKKEKTKETKKGGEK